MVTIDGKVQTQDEGVRETTNAIERMNRENRKMYYLTISIAVMTAFLVVAELIR